jgi:hypothetical protein
MVIPAPNNQQAFSDAQALFEKVKGQHTHPEDWDTLSMGMSGDLKLPLPQVQLWYASVRHCLECVTTKNNWRGSFESNKNKMDSVVGGCHILYGESGCHHYHRSFTRTGSKFSCHSN